MNTRSSHPLRQRRSMRCARVVAEALKGADDGELFIEHGQSESLTFDNGRLKGGSFNTDQGFGLRAVAGEAVGYAHAGELSLSALKRASDAVGAVTRGYSGSYAAAPQRHQQETLWRRKPDRRTELRGKGRAALGDRRLSARQGLQGSPGHGLDRRELAGGRYPARRRAPDARCPADDAPQHFRRRRRWRPAGKRLLRRRRPTRVRRFHCHRQLAAMAPTRRCARRWSISKRSTRRPAPWMWCSASGWPGVMLHEAVGHGLEGDFNRKKTSAFAGLLGETGGGQGRNRRR